MRWSRVSLGGGTITWRNDGFLPPVIPEWSRPVLVLTRKPNQRINIGDDIVITVLEVRGDQVRLGIDAPRHVGVQREEIYLKSKSEGEERRAG